MIRAGSDYQMKLKIGQGAYGTVYLVQHVVNKEEVSGCFFSYEFPQFGRQFQYALKRIIMQPSDEGIPQSVLREIAALTALKRFNHPNITRWAGESSGVAMALVGCRLHDAFILQTEEGGMSLNVVFDKCDWDLYDFLNKIERHMEEPQIKYIARQVDLRRRGERRRLFARLVADIRRRRLSAHK